MLINCVAYQNGSRLADLPVEEISDYLTKPGCFVWVALCDATPQELDQMKEEFNLHELAVEDARHGHQRPKIEEYGDSVFAVMHQLELDQGEFSVSEVMYSSDVILCCPCGTIASNIFWRYANVASANPSCLNMGPGSSFMR